MKDVSETKVSQETLELAADTLTGDVTAFLIDRLRDWECAYRYMPEHQQRAVIDDAMRAAGHLVESVVSIIAADGRETIPIRVKKVENDGAKIKVTIEASKEDANRHALFDAAGCVGHLVVADPEKFSGGDVPAPDPDEPNLPNVDDDELPDLE